MTTPTLKFELTIDQANAIINALNAPFQTTATIATALIQLLQDQASPQLEALQIEQAKAIAEKAEAKNEQ